MVSYDVVCRLDSLAAFQVPGHVDKLNTVIVFDAFCRVEVVGAHVIFVAVDLSAPGPHDDVCARVRVEVVAGGL